MPPPQVVSEEVRAAPRGAGLFLRLAVIDYIALALQGSVMSHLQTPLTSCDLAPIVAIFVGFRQGFTVGGLHGLFLGLADGALLAEPTGIPALVTFLLGCLAGASREGFQVERRSIRLWLALSLLVGAQVLTPLVHLAVWQEMPPVPPLSLAVCALIAPPVEMMVYWLLPED